MADKGMVAGLYYAQIALRDSSGYPMGQQTDPDNVSAGTTTHAYLINHPVTVNTLDVARTVAVERSGMQIRGQMQLGVESIGTFTMDLGEYDETFHALVTGSSVDSSTSSAQTMTGLNVFKRTPPQMFLLLTAGFQTASGTNEYLTYVYPNVTIAPSIPGLSQSGGDNPNPNTYTVTPAPSTRHVTGHLLSATGMNVDEDKDIFIRMRGTKPVGVTTYIDNGTGTSFTLGYRPTSSDATGGAENIVTKNGTTSSVTSINTTTGVVTITAATSGDKWIVVYETDFAAI